MRGGARPDPRDLPFFAGPSGDWPSSTSSMRAEDSTEADLLPSVVKPEARRVKATTAATRAREMVEIRGAEARAVAAVVEVVAGSSAAGPISHALAE